MSQLWNDKKAGNQEHDEDFKYNDIIESNNLLDETEENDFRHRKDNQERNDMDEITEK